MTAESTTSTRRSGDYLLGEGLYLAQEIIDALRLEHDEPMVQTACSIEVYLAWVCGYTIGGFDLFAHGSSRPQQPAPTYRCLVGQWRHVGAAAGAQDSQFGVDAAPDTRQSVRRRRLPAANGWVV